MLRSQDGSGYDRAVAALNDDDFVVQPEQYLPSRTEVIRLVQLLTYLGRTEDELETMRVCAGCAAEDDAADEALQVGVHGGVIGTTQGDASVWE